ncbi:MAG: DUF4852 domain-containing protein [Proteobacteria bacterium]|nr:DUF4852 domain-containing protein [Pseudomonadota bacterium]
MKQYFRICLLLLVFAVTDLSSAWATGGRAYGGDGYAPVTFKELSQTMALMGGIDVNNQDAVDEYAKLFYCEQYKKIFKNDIDLYDFRKMITTRVQAKRIYYRTLYEISSSFQLGRYDPEGQFFPLSGNTAMVNVGSLLLSSGNEWKSYCGIGRPSDFFPATITLVLNRPLTLSVFKSTVEQAKNLLERMNRLKNTRRLIYGRIRFRVLDAAGLVSAQEGRFVRAELKGDITSIDFFLDSGLTQPIGSVLLSR